jgi:protein ImuB
MLWLALHLPALSLDAFAATLGARAHVASPRCSTPIGAAAGQAAVPAECSSPPKRPGLQARSWNGPGEAGPWGPLEPAAQPLALLDGHRVAAVNAAARRLGVEPGCKRATALALAPHLIFGRADAGRDAQALRTLAHAALAFTPMVAIDAEAGRPCVLLEVQGSLRCFGGLARLQQRLLAAVAALPPFAFECRLASAPTAAGAALLARWRAGFELGAHAGDRAALHALLDRAPLALLAPAQAEALQDMGLRTLGDLRRLPRAAAARRFGPALLAAIDRARGDAPDPREAVQPEATFDARLELPERADRSEQLLAAAALLLARLVAWAQARHGRIGGCTLALRHEPRHRADAATPAATELALALAEPSNDPRHLQLLLRERLAQLMLPAPVLELRLRCDRLQSGAAPSGELFPAPAGAQEGLARLIERLQARLGPERVQRPVAVAEHRPERCTTWQPADPAAAALPTAARVTAARVTAAAAAAAARLLEAPVPPPGRDVPACTRPIWLLAQPQPLAERRSRPWLDGGPLQLLAGPERIESGWWDGAPALRDYFVASAADGTLVWIYRARLPGGDAGADGWFLHGRFG